MQVGELQQGQLSDVTNVRIGTETLSANIVGDQTLFVYDSSDFDDQGGQLVIYVDDVTTYQLGYTTKDDDLGTITLTSPLTVAVEAETMIFIYPYANEKQGQVIVDGDEDVVVARIPYNLSSQLNEGIRDPSQYESVLIQLQGSEYVLVDLPGKDEYMDGTALDPSTVPPSGSSVISTAPVLSVLAGYASVFASWTQVVPDDTSFVGPMNYAVYVSTTSGFTPGPSNLYTTTQGLLVQIMSKPDGSALPTGAPTYVKVIAFTTNHSSPTSNQASATALAPADPALLATLNAKFPINTADIAAGAVTASQIGSGAVGVAALATGAVTATAIAANAVTSTAISSGAVGSSAIAANAVGATAIAAGAVTANKLSVIIGAGNLLDNSNFIDTTLPVTFGNCSRAQELTTVWRQGHSLKVTSTNASNAFGIGVVPVKDGVNLTSNSLTAAGLQPNTLYTFSVWVYNPSTGGVADVRIVTSGTGLTTNPSATTTTLDSWVKLSVTFTTAATMSNTFTIRTGSSANPAVGLFYYVGAWQLELGDVPTSYSPKADEILPGTVVASMIAADTITASQIAASAITATELAAGAVTANKLAVIVGGGNLLLNTNNGILTSLGSNGGSATLATEVTQRGPTGGQTVKITTVSQAFPMGAQRVVTGLLPNTSYVASVWVFIPSSGGPTGGVLVSFGGAGVTSQPSSAAVTATGVWTKITAPFVTNATATPVNINIVTATAVSTSGLIWYIDQMQLETGDVATAYAPAVDEILPGTIVASMIAADTITASQIAAGAITASEIAAGAVTANKLLVTTGGNNMVTDSSFETSSAIMVTSGWIINAGTMVKDTAQKYIGTQSLKITPGGNENYGYYPPDGGTIGSSGYSKPLCVSGRQYTASLYVYADTAQNFALYNYGSPNVAGPTVAVAANTWTRLYVTFTAGATNFISPRVPGRATALLGNFWVDAFQIEEGDFLSAYKPNAEEILPGTIVTGMIVANAITSNEIAANTIQAADIAALTITAAQIAATTITAAQIAAGTITATQIASGTITTTQLTATAIDGMTITGSTIRTAASGARINIGASGTQEFVQFYTGGVNETTPGSLQTLGSPAYALQLNAPRTTTSNATKTYITVADGNITINTPNTGSNQTQVLGGLVVSTGDLAVQVGQVSAVGGAYISTDVTHNGLGGTARMIADIVRTQYPPTTTSAANARIGAAGDVNLVTSLTKHKHNPQPISLKRLRALAEVPIVDWIDQEERKANEGKVKGLKRVPGALAEDVNAIDPTFADHKDGELVGVQYDRLALVSLPLISDLYKRIEKLEAQLAS